MNAGPPLVHDVAQVVSCSWLYFVWIVPLLLLLLLAVTSTFNMHGPREGYGQPRDVMAAIMASWLHG